MAVKMRRGESTTAALWVAGGFTMALWSEARREGLIVDEYLEVSDAGESAAAARPGNAKPNRERARAKDLDQPVQQIDVGQVGGVPDKDGNQ